MTVLRNRLKQFFRCTSGTAIIEAALVMPIIIILMGGLFDMGRAYSTMSAAQKSLRGAVRYLTLLPSGAVCGWGTTNAKNLAVYGNVGGTGTPVIPGWATSNITLDLPTSCSPTVAVGKIKMSATVPYSSLMWGVVGLPNSITMNVTHEERWVGQ